jgi:AcrR family transcriptional regulator
MSTEPSNVGTETRPRRLRAAKRAAIMRAARLVFGRDGYARSSIDAIAVEAGVSTRTIYNHFANKEELFTEVLRTSATEVADAFIATVARTVGDPPDLVAVGRALVAQRAEHVEHFAMMRHINVEAGHFPREVLATWREAGPLRVEREVARQLRRLAGHGLLRDDDLARMARHFIVLATAEVTSRIDLKQEPMSKDQVDAAIAAGVEAFLHGYAARPRQPPRR